MTQRPVFGCLLEIVETLVLTLLIFFVIQNFVAQPYKVQQKSMERTLEEDQYVLVDKLTPRFDAYNRGDIVVFQPPQDWGETDTPFIKRVIGEPGEIFHPVAEGREYQVRIIMNPPEFRLIRLNPRKLHGLLIGHLANGE